MTQKTFSFRFDIDSLSDLEVGVPELLRIAKTLDVRFTFFVNMGRSLSRYSVLRRRGKGGVRLRSVITRHQYNMNKLGLWRTVKTLALNPKIGMSQKKILFSLLDQGHELGLHGGINHSIWQWNLDNLNKNQINSLIKPAYDDFANLFGKPAGFSSPGFKYNRYVLELMDDYKFKYASDMEGEAPFKPEGFQHLQIPVNVKGHSTTPLIEYLYSCGLNKEEIMDRCRVEIAKRKLVVIYGHPAFEGTFYPLDEILTWVRNEGYKVLPMGELI